MEQRNQDLNPDYLDGDWEDMCYPKEFGDRCHQQIDDFFQQPDGPLAEIRFHDGRYYKGDIKNGRREGKGFFINPKYDIEYYGDWKEGHPHGRGTLRIPSRGYTYVGEFSGGVRRGKGMSLIGNRGDDYHRAWEDEWHNDRVYKKLRYGRAKYIEELDPQGYPIIKYDFIPFLTYYPDPKVQYM